jgi:hypothetical protein
MVPGVSQPRDPLRPSRAARLTSLDNLTPADVYFGRAQTILTRSENTKLKTIELRRRLHHATSATTSTQIDQILS